MGEMDWYPFNPRKESIHIAKIEKRDVTSCGDLSTGMTSKWNPLTLCYLPPTLVEKIAYLLLFHHFMVSDWTLAWIGKEESIGLIHTESIQMTKNDKSDVTGCHHTIYGKKNIKLNTERPPDQSDSHMFIFHHWITSFKIQYFYEIKIMYNFGTVISAFLR